ncbi:hypothetical protein MUP77_00565 [Candidatus Bathyarchaeota archaeon]|nr:hypothetical protein [Candidatus Bathyarchaeota archaeon]
MGKTERKTIKIISVANWRDAGKAKVLEFGGEDRVNYETWSESLAEHIKVGATIEADVEFSERIHEGKTYFHNKVVQIYIDGKPVKSRERPFGVTDSPEKIASIESQKRADLICQLYIAGKIAGDDILIVKARAWLSLLGITAPVAAASATKTPAATTKPTAKPTEAAQFTNAGEFLTTCSKMLGLNKSMVMEILKVDSLDKLNFTDAYLVLKEHKK